MTLSVTESVLSTHPGLNIHWIWSEPGQEFYRHQRSFISESLHEAEGELLFRTAEPPIPKPVESTTEFQNRIGELDSKPTWNVSLLRGSRLDQEFPPTLLAELPPLWKMSKSDLIPEPIRHNELTSPPPSDFRFITYHEATAVIETESSFGESERTIRRRHSTLSTEASDPGYSGPLFTYKRGVDGFAETTLLELAGAINLAWGGGVTSSCAEISQQVFHDAWEEVNVGKTQIRSDQRPPAGVETVERYVLRPEPTEPQDQTDLLEPESQLRKPHDAHRNRSWFLRLFDVSRQVDGNIPVIAEARQEPPDIGHLRNDLPVIDNPNWRFDRARNETRRVWDDGFETRMVDTGVGDLFNGHDGGMALIENHSDR